MQKKDSSSHSVTSVLLNNSQQLSPNSNWRSAYTRSVLLKLSIREAIRRQSNIISNRQLSSFPSSTLPPLLLLRPSPPPPVIMSSALHQYSTIRSVHNVWDRSSNITNSLSSLPALDIGLDLKPVLCEVEFEVFGDISGTFFTRYAKEMSQKLTLKGWIRVSPRGSIYGQIQGEKNNVDEMALWLRLQGSPGCRIESCQFKNWKVIDSCDFRNFSVRY
ncbi:uncharacterized protein LOC128952195 [Oppia nitens]|uniref:uncharacterized protein LOC128952195 n=1 Tax=Oppia nitens TaxID=1686743 RepID=UPI0023D988D9|nr:uncharacterized protein LOC128952195 [Oppia nitens]